MKTALIGFTGFVGQNLLDQYLFDDIYNSKNIRDIEGKNYDIIVCAGVKAVKWWANQNPLEDLEGINNLIHSLAKVKAEKFILISTVDVYSNPLNVDEDFDLLKLDQDSIHPYGRNRIYLENFIRNTFENSFIIRLPGLFGKFLKKNIIFDLLNNNQTDKIIPNSKFQYYFLGNLWKDIEFTVSNNIHLINFNSEPIETHEIVSLFFLGIEIGELTKNPIIYDCKTKYFEAFGGKNGYMYSKNTVLKQLGVFIENYSQGN